MINTSARVDGAKEQAVHKGGYTDKDGNKFSALIVLGKRQEYQRAKRAYYE